MERHPVFLNWKNIVNFTKSNLQTENNPYRKSNDIFHRNRVNNPKICTAAQKIPNSQSNLEKEGQS